MLKHLRTSAEKPKEIDSDNYYDYCDKYVKVVQCNIVWLGLNKTTISIVEN